jgi:protein-disulfide isomerase
MTLNAMPGDGQLALAPLDENVDHVRGSPVGLVIIEYGDYECPYSRQAFQAIELAGQQLGGNGGLASGQVLDTPTLFIDGVLHRGCYDPPTLLAALDVRFHDTPSRTQM